MTDPSVNGQDEALAAAKAWVRGWFHELADLDERIGKAQPRSLRDAVRTVLNALAAAEVELSEYRQSLERAQLAEAQARIAAQDVLLVEVGRYADVLMDRIEYGLYDRGADARKRERVKISEEMRQRFCSTDAPTAAAARQRARIEEAVAPWKLKLHWLIGHCGRWRLDDTLEFPDGVVLKSQDEEPHQLADRIRSGTPSGSDQGEA